MDFGSSAPGLDPRLAICLLFNIWATHSTSLSYFFILYNLPQTFESNKWQLSSEWKVSHSHFKTGPSESSGFLTYFLRSGVSTIHPRCHLNFSFSVPEPASLTWLPNWAIQRSSVQQAGQIWNALFNFPRCTSPHCWLSALCASQSPGPWEHVTLSMPFPLNSSPRSPPLLLKEQLSWETFPQFCDISYPAKWLHHPQVDSTSVPPAWFLFTKLNTNSLSCHSLLPASLISPIPASFQFQPDRFIHHCSTAPSSYLALCLSLGSFLHLYPLLDVTLNSSLPWSLPIPPVHFLCLQHWEPSLPAQAYMTRAQCIEPTTAVTSCAGPHNLLWADSPQGQELHLTIQILQ